MQSQNNEFSSIPQARPEDLATLRYKKVDFDTYLLSNRLGSTSGIPGEIAEAAQ